MGVAKKRVTFVYRNYEGLGIAYIASYVRSLGHDVQLVLYPDPWSDTYIKQKDKETPMTGRLQHRVNRQLHSEVRAFAPDLICFSTVTDDYRWCLAEAAALKEVTGGALTIFGGVHVTSVPERVLHRPEVDFLGLGEGERTVGALLEHLDDWRAGEDLKIPGLWYVRDGRVVQSGWGEAVQDLDTLPFPAKDLFYARLPGLARTYSITSSRGCPYACTYCYNAVMLPKYREQGKWMRQRSVDGVIAELTWARKHFNPRHVLFHDDVFASNTKWVEEFAPRYRREIGLPFGLVTEVIVLKEDVVRQLKEAGLVNVQVGVQTLNDESKRRIDRPESKAQTEHAFAALNKYGVHYQVDHMLGIPGETDADQRDAVTFYNTFRPDIVSVFWLKYYPKLPIIDFAIEKGILKRDDLEDIEEGRNEASYIFGGNAPDFRKWLGYNMIFGWLNFLPRRVVDFLLVGNRIEWVAWESFFFSQSVPRLLSVITRRPDFRGRDHLRRLRGQLVYILKLAWRDWRARGDGGGPGALPAPAIFDGRQPVRGVLVGRRSGGRVVAVGGPGNVER